MVPRRRSLHQRADGERGAAMVEFAVVAVILVTMFLGLVDAALLVRTRNAVRDAADDGARRASVSATDKLADFHILRQIESSGANVLNTLNLIVVYKVVPGEDGPSAVCRSGASVTGECNAYSASDLVYGEANFGCTVLDAAWCPTDRLTSEQVGVWISADYDALLLGTSIGLQGDSRLRLESSGGA